MACPLVPRFLKTFVLSFRSKEKKRWLREWKEVGSDDDGRGGDVKEDMVDKPRQDMGGMGNKEPDVVTMGVRVLDGGSMAVDRMQGWLWRRVQTMKALAKGRYLEGP